MSLYDKRHTRSEYVIQTGPQRCELPAYLWKTNDMLILGREMPGRKTRVNKASSSVRILNAQSLNIQDQFLYPLRVNYLYNKQGNYRLFCKLSQRKADYPGLGDWTNSERKYGYFNIHTNMI